MSGSFGWVLGRVKALEARALGITDYGDNTTMAGCFRFLPLIKASSISNAVAFPF